MGIFGDFLFSDVNRFGSGFMASAFGPTGDIIDQGRKLTFGNVVEAMQGKDTNFSLEAIRFMEQNTPSIWQIHPIKAAMFDQLEQLADSDAQRKQALARRKRMREYNQDYWWAPGEPLPNVE